MKKILTLLSIGLFAVAAHAQKIDVRETNEKIGDGSHNALVVTIYQATADDIESKWRSKMKDMDGKVSSKGGIFADNAMLKSNGNNPVDIYMRVEKGKEGESKLIVGVDMGGAWMTSSQHGEQFREMKNIVNDFAIKMTKEGLAGITKEEEKKLEKLKDQQKDLEKDQASLLKDIEDYKAKIEEYKSKISKAESDISKNKSDQEKKKSELEAQQKVFDAAMSKEKAVN
ncbi:MAG: laminin subunit beta-1 [Bacteroidetes bacterium]|nr:MAG: laminin subunit beta-1 [Bacteroidota bacterium]